MKKRERKREREKKDPAKFVEAKAQVQGKGIGGLFL